MPIVRLSEQRMVRPIEIVTNCLLKCHVYREGGKEGQFIKVNYRIQSRHGIMITGLLVQQGNRTTALFHQRQIPHRGLNSTAWVAYRAHGSVISVKHRQLVTDCQRLTTVPIVLQSCSIASAADVSVKLYCLCILNDLFSTMFIYPNAV